MRIPVWPLLPLSLLAACGSWSNPVARLDPHRVEIQQGNLVTEEMLARLKPGMSPSQVRFALGTPLIVNPFRADRWDYVYTVQRGGRQIERRRITVLFENDRLKRIDGDLPSPIDGTGTAPTPSPEARP